MLTAVQPLRYVHSELTCWCVELYNIGRRGIIIRVDSHCTEPDIVATISIVLNRYSFSDWCSLDIVINISNITLMPIYGTLVNPKTHDRWRWEITATCHCQIERYFVSAFIHELSNINYNFGTCNCNLNGRNSTSSGLSRETILAYRHWTISCVIRIYICCKYHVYRALIIFWYWFTRIIRRSHD